MGQRLLLLNKLTMGSRALIYAFAPIIYSADPILKIQQSPCRLCEGCECTLDVQM